MNLPKFKTPLITLVLIVSAFVDFAPAQEWARKMFKEYVHDFQKVPLGEIPEYRFEIENLYEEDIRIRSINSSCGCTVATATQKVLKTWDKAQIVCKFNTPAVGAGLKKATVTVRFEFGKSRNTGEVQLTVQGMIVTGLTFTPETIDFGQVTANKFPVKTVRITSSGNPYLRIVDVKSKYEHITVFAPKRVSATGNAVIYELATQLKPTAPKGYSQGELYVVVEENPRNRRNNRPVLKQIPVQFNAKVVSDLRVAPEILTLGSIKPGETKTQKVFLTADQPFKITDVKCQSSAYAVKADPQSKKVHIVEVSYTGIQEPGRHEEELSFYTDLDSKASGKMKAIADIVKPVVQNEDK